MKLLDKKLKKIRSSSYKPKDFIIADAKDAGSNIAFEP